MPVQPCDWLSERLVMPVSVKALGSFAVLRCLHMMIRRKRLCHGIAEALEGPPTRLNGELVNGRREKLPNYLYARSRTLNVSVRFGEIPNVRAWT
jgi:hypothetical protein